jgi:hypothetical protein
MQVFSHVLADGVWTRRGQSAPLGAQLAFVFAPEAQLRQPEAWQRLRALHPQARIVACSSGAQILGAEVLEDGLLCTGVRLERSGILVASVRTGERTDAQALGRLLAERLEADGLRHVLVLAEGLVLNGGRLAEGMIEALPPGVRVTGGLAGDGERFEATGVFLDGHEEGIQAVAIGLYGEALRIGHGCAGGWEPFGIERRITLAHDNELLELDGEPALNVYRRYLGPQAADLPASGLLFPLAIWPAEQGTEPLVRTIRGIDEARGSLKFAGDMPVGCRARLMKAQPGSLASIARQAMAQALSSMQGSAPQLALVVSCECRKIVMRQDVLQELELAREALGPQASIAGFFSYGELAPLGPEAGCALHNQTLTLTTLAEA